MFFVFFLDVLICFQGVSMVSIFLPGVSMSADCLGFLGFVYGFQIANQLRFGIQKCVVSY